MQALTVDHDGRLRLLTAYCQGRKQTRAAVEFYDRIVIATGNDAASCVAQAADDVYARLDAGATTEPKAMVQLAALLCAWRTLR